MDYSKAECKICGHKAHILVQHIIDEHGMSLEDYVKQHGEFLSEPAKAKFKAMTAEADNEVVSASIKKLFGVSFRPDKPNTWHWKVPHATTPKVDPNYVFRTDVVSLVIIAHEDQDERVLFIGPTGSGKSTGVIQAAARLNVPFYRANLDNEVTKADFIGQYILKGDETIYQHGTLALAMKQGAWLLVDEWDMGNPGVTAALQAVLEGNPLQIGDTGEIIHPAQGFRIFATGNTVGQGDETGLYSGTQVQNFAQLDRFTMVETVDYPDPKTESAIVKSQAKLNDDNIKSSFGVAELTHKDNSASIIKHIIKTGKLVRQSFKKEEISTTMSTRTLVNIGRKLLMFGDIKKAYEVAYLNKLTTEDREFVIEIIQREWGV